MTGTALSAIFCQVNDLLNTTSEGARVSAVAQSVVSPIRSGRRAEPRRSQRLDLSQIVILELHSAPDVRKGMQAAAESLRRLGGARRVEWWAPTEDGTSFRLEAADGQGLGRRSAIPAGPAGAIVVTGGHWSHDLIAAANRLAPQLRRRFTDERLAAQAARLARRNEALEDFASLIAHELKAPLNAALLQRDTVAAVEQALELVDTVLEAARAEASADEWCAPAGALAAALDDLGAVTVAVEAADLPGRFPLPAATLRLVLRNLVANAIAAGAQHINVSSGWSGDDPVLVVSDDGVGLGATNGYTRGSGLGLGLMRRLAGRFGGKIELTAGLFDNGTHAVLTVPWS
jgi:signal transduction histidine kinase